MNIAYSCPKCGTPLTYGGMLVWRSGPRPPCNQASKNVGFSPRADYERERTYHCGAEFREDVEQRYPYLYEEGARGKYVYSALTWSWEQPSPGRARREKDTKRLI